jgi:hypothetical protein
MYQKKAAPQWIYKDLTLQNKRSQNVEQILLKQKNHNAVVEYCLSGARVKLRIDSENVVIPFGIQGVRGLTNDQNQPKMLELSNQAKDFAKEELH